MSGIGGTTHKPILHTGEKRKQVYMGTSIPQRKKRKDTKEKYIQSLTYDGFERIWNQVK
jgi:hypothetical protein